MNPIKTVKKHVTIVIVSYSIIVAISILTFSLFLMNSFQLRTAVNSAEFNLQLVSNMIEQDLINLTVLSSWCAHDNSAISKYYSSSSVVNQSSILGVDAYNRMNTEFLQNRSSLYVRRLLAISSDKQKILQVGNYAMSGIPANSHSIDLLLGLIPEPPLYWKVMDIDPFVRNSISESLVMQRPLYHNRSNEKIGTVVLMVSTSMITNKLKGYALIGDSQLFFQIGEQIYQIENDDLIPVEPDYSVISRNTIKTVSPNTTVLQIRTPHGQKRTLVICPIRDDITLTQLLPEDPVWLLDQVWVALIICLIILVIALALVVLLHMDRMISRPVTHIRKRIDAIAQGDFTPDPEIEYASELGLVGQGINNLSRDIVALMENRIADENEKRDLEYRMLQSQINPHFLHNTLNSIKWMATFQGSKGISEMTTSLSRLLKCISNDIRKLVPLKDELELVKDYMVIQKYRYGDSVRVETVIESSELLDTQLPRFSLQPLIENAIFHGIEPKGSGNIRVIVKRKDEVALITVWDDGLGVEKDLLQKIFENHTSSSRMFVEMGLRNVDERIRFTFGETFGLSMESIKDEYTAVTIRVPNAANTEDGI